MLRNALVALLLLSGLACAQYPAGAVGFYWQGTSTPTSGTFCWGTSCAPYPVTITANETVTLTIRGDFGMPYVVGIAPTATRCLTIPNAYNSLILDDPVSILFQGALGQVSAILACPPGFATLPATLPMSVPPGTTFSLQAAALSGGPGFAQLAFTTAFDVTVI